MIKCKKRKESRENIMTNDLQVAIQDIQHRFHKGLHDIFHPMKKEWIRIYNVLQQGEEIEVHDSEVFLAEVIVKGETCQAVVIKDEQHTDLIVAIHPKEEMIFIYAFKHEYDEEEEYECSIVKKILKQSNLEQYQPIYVIQDQYKEKPAERLYRPDYKELSHFQLIFECILSELEEEEEYDGDVLSSKLESSISKKFKHVFEQQNEAILDLYRNLKENGNIMQDESRTCYLKRIQVKNNSLPNEEKEEEYRDAIVMGQGEVQYVIVFLRLEDNEFREVQNIHFYCCESNRPYAVEMNDLFENYNKYKKRSIFKIQNKKVKIFNEEDAKFDPEYMDLYAGIRKEEIYHYVELEAFFTIFNTIMSSTIKNK